MTDPQDTPLFPALLDQPTIEDTLGAMFANSTGATKKTHESGIAAAQAIAAETGVEWHELRRIAAHHLAETDPDLEEIGTSDVSIHLSYLGNYEADWLRAEAEQLKWGNEKLAELMAATGKTREQVLDDLRRLLGPAE